MARRWLQLPALCLALLTSCGDSGAGNGVANPTLACEGNNNLARLWGTFARGELLVPGDPIILPGYLQFVHPTSALLGFWHPPEWGSSALVGGADVGVDLLRQDGGGFYHFFTTFDPNSAIPINQWRQEGVTRALAAMGDTGAATALCSVDPTTIQNNTGGTTQFTAVVVLTANSVVLHAVSLNAFDSLIGNGVAVQTYAGNRAQFNQIAQDVFFSIISQLIVPVEGQDRDTDLDGFIDRLDDFPLDPTRH